MEGEEEIARVSFESEKRLGCFVLILLFRYHANINLNYSQCMPKVFFFFFVKLFYIFQLCL